MNKKKTNPRKKATSPENPVSTYQIAEMAATLFCSSKSEPVDLGIIPDEIPETEKASPCSSHVNPLNPGTALDDLIKAVRWTIKLLEASRNKIEPLQAADHSTPASLELAKMAAAFASHQKETPIFDQGKMVDYPVFLSRKLWELIQYCQTWGVDKGAIQLLISIGRENCFPQAWFDITKHVGSLEKQGLISYDDVLKMLMISETRSKRREERFAKYMEYYLRRSPGKATTLIKKFKSKGIEMSDLTCILASFWFVHEERKKEIKKRNFQSTDTKEDIEGKKKSVKK